MSDWTLLHTADWHLGHSLHGHARHGEHAAFLRWLTATIVEREVDLLLVAGDVFDARTPPASAQAQLFEFLAATHAARPSLEVLLLAGNHDSAARLAAPRPLLSPLGVTVVAAATPEAPASELVVPVRRRGERLGAIAAIPYLRPGDLAGVGDGLDPARLSGAIAALHASVGRAARADAGSGAVVAAAHGEVRGAILSPRSERAVAAGGTSAPAETMLCPEAAYVALGHLHFAQAVGSRGRYAGSPIPLALDEGAYRHSVTLVGLRGANVERVDEVPVPRTADVVRIPQTGAVTPEVATELLAALPAADGRSIDELPFVEVHVALGATERGLRSRIEEALLGRAARLTRIVVEDAARPARATRPSLAELDVREMVVRKWEAEHGASPPPEILAALDEAVAAATAAEGDEASRRRALVEGAA